MTFTSSLAVSQYLPASGIPAPLTGDLLNPSSSSSGEFGGQVLALQVNVDFSDAGVLTSSTPLGYLRICNFTLVPDINDQTVRQFLATANTMLGGEAGPFSVAIATGVAAGLNSAFLNGTPSTFAQNTLVAAPTCPPD